MKNIYIKSIKNKIIFLIKIGFFLATLPIRIVNFILKVFIFKYFNIQNSNEIHSIFLIMFCATGGWSNSLISKFLSKKKLNLDKIKNDSFHRLLNFEKINKYLSQNGYYQQKDFLTDEEFRKIYNYILTLKGYFISDYLNHDGNEKYLELLNFNKIKGAKFNLLADDLLKNHAIQKLLIDKDILKIVQEYLGSLPIIDAVNAWWSFPTDKPDSSAAQLWHFDFERPKWIKVFFYLTDCNENNGPHCFIEKTHCNGGIPITIRSKLYSRIQDKTVNEIFNKNSIKVMTASKKSILFEDTRGLHKGLNLKSGKRLILQFQYSSSLFGAVTKKSKFPNNPSEEFLNLKVKFPNIFENFI